jgi:hypothetical protein
MLIQQIKKIFLIHLIVQFQQIVLQVKLEIQVHRKVIQQLETQRLKLIHKLKQMLRIHRLKQIPQQIINPILL